MTAVVVVTRNPALAMGLQHHGYDVVDVRPDRYGDWVHDAHGADAVVLELGDAIAAESAVQRLRAERVPLPVLLVASSSPGWDITAEHLGPGTKVLPLPISLPALMASLEALIDAGPVTLPPVPTNEDELLSHVAASIGMTISDTGTLVTDEGPVTVPRVRVDLSEPEPAPAPAPVPVPVPEPVPMPDPEPLPVPDLEPVPMPEPEPVPAPEPAPEPPHAPVSWVSGPGAERLVAALTQRVHELAGIDDCADVALDELVDRLGAEAAALLLPDGEEWRVAGGRGLRPLETRVRLDATHWLVSHVVEDGNAVLTTDTEPALAGAPLASWRFVVGVPVPEVRGVLLAARAHLPFEPAALDAAVGVAREAAPLLGDALAVRELARALAPFADLDE